MFVHEGSERWVSWRQAVRTELIAVSVSVQVECYPMFARFVTDAVVAHEGRTHSVCRRIQSFFGLDTRKIDLVRGSIASSLAICRVSISVVVDDVATLVDFQHGLELGVGDDVHGGRQRDAEIQLYAQVALLYQVEAGAITLVGGKVEAEGAARAGSRSETVRSLRPATSCRSR